ncbi:single strand DNA binding protein [Pseudomonas phage PspYZU05]|uniref:Single-stranded DNA-binding protein n=1 Tax=Pseudomonas phage PspYZU05 TaxID=1983556 RepID=A0A2U7NLW8_9CAUD|nr:single strand DNA binding protein [Pseudomonas phage PspYZU05]ASD52118.1 single-stranded DNA-binding protein [Pseudomonas phage PspYZU05]
MFKRKDPAKLQAQLQAMKGSSGFQSDATEWKLKVDNAGNGGAVIRFLPGRGDEAVPFVKLINHGFKIANKWYIENCTSTHGDFESCPVCAHLSANDSYNTNKPEYDKLKRKTSYWANILVIKDPKAPENEGKVFKYRFGQKIMDKINSMIEVDEAMGETPVDVTCPFGGANFSLKVKRVGEHQNYDECKFNGISELPNINSEAYQRELFEAMHDIMSISAPAQFKGLEENTKKFKQVMGVAAMGTAASRAAAQADDFESQLNEFEATKSKTVDDQEDVFVDEPVTSPSNSLDNELDDLLDDLGL